MTTGINNDLVLASASRTRQKLLQNAGLKFHTLAADLDEDCARQKYAGAGPSLVAVSLAIEKACFISNIYTDKYIIGSDQILAVDNEIVTKSRNMVEARQTLSRLQGRDHRLFTAVALVRGGVQLFSHIEETKLVMRQMTDSEIDTYLNSVGEDILYSVGCYQVEGLGLQLFKEINGDYFSILGLPVLPLINALKDIEIKEDRKLNCFG